MSKKMKLDLENLEIQSFVTTLNSGGKFRVKAGGTQACSNGPEIGNCGSLLCGGGPTQDCSDGECENTIDNTNHQECCHVE